MGWRKKSSSGCGRMEMSIGKTVGTKNCLEIGQEGGQC